MRTRPFLVPVVLTIAAGTGGFLAGRHLPAQTASADGPPVSRRIASIAEGTRPQPAATSGTAPSGDTAASGNSHFSKPSQRLLETLEELAEAEKNRSVEDLFASWVAHNPEEALRFMESSPRRDDILRKAAAEWSKADAAAASGWLAAHPSVPGRDAMAAGLAAAVAKDEPDAAIQWVSSIKDPLQKLAGAQGAGYEFFRQSDEAALAALGKMGLPASSFEPTLLEAWKRRLADVSRRSAQNVASAYAAAMAAGAESKAEDADAAIQEIVNGITGSGQFSTSTFQVNLDRDSEREQAATKNHLKFSNGTLNYTGE